MPWDMQQPSLVITTSAKSQRKIFFVRVNEKRSMFELAKKKGALFLCGAVFVLSLRSLTEERDDEWKIGSDF